MIKVFEFDTLGAAEAFIEGIEYVNDPSVIVKGWDRDGKTGKFVVTVEDRDAEA